MSEELLGVVSAAAYVGYAMGGVMNRVSFVDGWMLPLRGVLIA